MSDRTAPGRADYTEAMVDLAFERGYEEVAVEEVAARAGGDCAGFHRYFPDKQACAIAALEQMTAENQRIVREAYESAERWPDSLRTGAYAQARWIAGNPKKVRFLMLETLWASELTGALRDQFLTEYTAMIDEGRAIAPDPDSVPPLAAASVIGAITQAITRFSSDTGNADPVAAVPGMMYLAVRPYLGEEAARRELATPPPEG